jgi:hypothetical protein
MLQSYIEKFSFIYHNSGINTFGGVPILQTYGEKPNSIYHIPASTLLGGVPMMQTRFCSPQLRHQHFVGVPMLQSYKEKFSFVYHSSGINTFVRVPMLQTHFYSPEFRHEQLVECQCFKLTARNIYFFLPPYRYEDYWKLPFLKDRQTVLRFWLLSLEAAAACSNQALKMAVMG